jgi:hypothetical protein
MGGIGGGNFNFLPNGAYNTTYIRVGVTAGAPPTCLGFSKRGASVWSSTNMQHSGSMTTTFTGYWPTVTLTYAQAGMLDDITLKAFSPICAGDNKNSSLPLCIYKFTIRNSGASSDTAAIALQNSANASIVSSGGRPVGIASGAICVLADLEKVDPADSITCGGASTGFTTTGLLSNSGAGFCAKRVVVPAGGTRTVTFSVAWTGVSNGYYRNYFTDVQVLAAHGRDSAVALEAKVDNWHNKILNSNLPAWLKDLVINSCHTYNSMTDWVTGGTYGTYGMVESSTSGNYGCIDQSFHGSMALPIFAPNAAWSEVTRIAGAQLPSGLVSHFYPGQNEVRSDGGAKLILQAYRNYVWTGNLTALNSLWSNYQNVINGIKGLDTDGDGLTDDNYINTYDNPMWDGWVIVKKEYDNELALAAMKAASTISTLRNDAASATNYNNAFNKTSTAFERPNSTGFWNTTLASRSGITGYYTGSTNIGGNGKAVWGCVLEGQWYADLCGLGPLHPDARTQSCLRFAEDVNFDRTSPNGSYVYMIAWPPDGGTHYQSAEAPGSPYVSYCEYPAAGFCVGFQHNQPDVAMKALNNYWNITFNKFHRVYNVPCKVAADGSGAGWGIGRYMFTAGVFSSLFGITGFQPDINGKSLRIKPSLPSNPAWKMDSLVAGPLMNPISLGTVDYKNNTTSGYQRFAVKFDSPMQFNTFYTKKMYTQSVLVYKPAVGGSAVPATIAVNSADTSEYQVTFGSTLTIDNTGVLITIPATPVVTHDVKQAKVGPIDFTVDMKRGTLSYALTRRTKVSISLVNTRGLCVMRHQAEEGAGLHRLRYNRDNLAAGVYYAHFKAGEGNGIKKVVTIR